MNYIKHCLIIMILLGVGYGWCCNSSVQCGDVNASYSWDILDIVILASCVLADNCEQLEYGCAADVNEDGNQNVIDIVALANCILAGNCEDL